MVNAVIKWMSGELPPDRDAAEAQIRKELDELMEDTSLDNLMFHTVFLGETMDDASVFVAPSDDDPTTVDCWYSERTTWTSIGATDDDSIQMAGQMREAMRDGPLPGSKPLLDPGEEI